MRDGDGVSESEPLCGHGGWGGLEGRFRDQSSLSGGAHMVRPACTVVVSDPRRRTLSQDALVARQLPGASRQRKTAAAGERDLGLGMFAV